ncbi:MAG TPA: lasso peptide biosynthesis B2 protein [Amycolatopsis sp.]|nr:lasso peptide biosynthesis B2 protein [Amycolatopsis sp.]
MRTRRALELVRALWTMVGIEKSLRANDLRTTCQRLRLRIDLRDATPPGSEIAVLPRDTRAAMWAAEAVTSHWPAGDTCLRRCLLVGHRLRALDPVLRIGVKRDARGAFAAHSWLEIDGRTLDTTAAEYAVLSAAGEE